MTVIFAKTSKGYEEIAQRGGGLTPRVRRLLILIDGKRSVEDLRAMQPSDDLTHTLGLLEEQGFIELAAGQASGAATSVPAQRLPSLTAFRELADTDPVSLAQARNFMTNTINAFVGSTGTSSLIDRIDNARSHADLRAAFDDWYHAISSSRDGRREAEALRKKLLEVI